jgi:carbohydrate-selective porin OprB
MLAPKLTNMRIITATVAVIASLAAIASAQAGAKDESAAEWLPLPKEFNDWRSSIADRGFSWTAAYVGDNITNATDPGRDRSECARD